MKQPNFWVSVPIWKAVVTCRICFQLFMTVISGSQTIKVSLTCRGHAADQLSTSGVVCDKHSTLRGRLWSHG